VRLLGVGVSGLEAGHDRAAGLDDALDRITERYGPGSVTGGLALRRNQRGGD
jgi:hypothetical protein